MKHGGNKNEAARAYGIEPAEMIDLSTGISPNPYPLSLSQLDLSDLIELPQEDKAASLKNIMRKAWSVPDSAEIALASGSGALISLIPHIHKGDMRQVYCPEPAYSEHPMAWQRAGFRMIPYEAGTIPEIYLNKTAAIIAVQPGNPMGHCASPDAWLELMEKAAAHKVMIIMDEAFIDLMPEQSLVPYLGRKGLIVIRSFGKFYGLAGVRLGAAIGHPDDITALEDLLGPWPVSAMAVQFAAEAMSDHGWADDQRDWCATQMASLKKELMARGITIIGGTDLYVLIEIEDAKTLQDKLARAGFWTRIFEHYPNWMRLGLARDDAATTRFLKALDKALD